MQIFTPVQMQFVGYSNTVAIATGGMSVTVVITGYYQSV